MHVKHCEVSQPARQIPHDTTTYIRQKDQLELQHEGSRLLLCLAMVKIAAACEVDGVPPWGTKQVTVCAN